MTEWHVIRPAVDGGYNSIDYTNNLPTAVRLARFWVRNGEDRETIRLAKGKNGEPLEFVTYYYDPKTRADVYVGAYRTARGARTAMNNVGRKHPEVFEYGFQKVGG
jgi:hypothetical protein